MHSFDIFHAYERRQWTLRDIPWHDLDKARARPEHIRFARAAVMGECNSIAALHGFRQRALGLNLLLVLGSQRIVE